MKKTMNCAQLALMLGISTTMVRNLEKSGIIAPKRNENNNYRSYAYIDLDRLIRWNYLRALSFEIPVVKKMSSVQQHYDFLKIITEQKEQVIREIVLNTARLSSLNELERDLMHNIDEEETFFDVFPETYFLPYYDRDTGIMVKNQNITQFAQWIELFPVAFPLQYAIYENESWRFIQSGIAISKENASRLNVCLDGAKLLNQHPCMCFLGESWDIDPDDPEKCMLVRQKNSERIHRLLDKNRLGKSKTVYYKTVNTRIEQNERICLYKMYCCIDD